MKHNKNVTPTVTNNTGVNCEKTLNPWTTFILLESPDIISPDANVKLNRNAVIIYLRILFISWNYDRRSMKPMIKNNTPKPIEI